MIAFAQVRFDWGSPISSIQIPNRGKSVKILGLSRNGHPHLVVSNAVLLVGCTQRNGRYDRASAGIRVRPGMYCPCAKAVERLLVDFLETVQGDMLVNR
jgi:hypothetical protein